MNLERNQANLGNTITHSLHSAHYETDKTKICELLFFEKGQRIFQLFSASLYSTVFCQFFGGQEDFHPILAYVAHLQSINTPGFEPGELPRQHGALDFLVFSLPQTEHRQHYDSCNDRCNDQRNDRCNDRWNDKRNDRCSDIFRQLSWSSVFSVFCGPPGCGPPDPLLQINMSKTNFGKSVSITHI